MGSVPLTKVWPTSAGGRFLRLFFLMRRILREIFRSCDQHPLPLNVFAHVVRRSRKKYWARRVPVLAIL